MDDLLQLKIRMRAGRGHVARALGLGLVLFSTFFSSATATAGELLERGLHVEPPPVGALLDATEPVTSKINEYARTSEEPSSENKNTAPGPSEGAADDPSPREAREVELSKEVAEGTEKDAEGLSKAATGKTKTINLFGYVEFRGQIKNMPKWERVLYAEKKDSSFIGNLNTKLPSAVAERWEKLQKKIKDLSLMEKAKAVNTFFNQWPYKTDIVNWKVEDYWATPREFVHKSGDCEDYAIAKYYALRELGVPASQMRVIAVIDRIRGIGHAVLVVFANDTAYILDNLTNLVLVHTRLTNYEPKFSVNEDYRWVHIKPISKPK